MANDLTLLFNTEPRNLKDVLAAKVLVELILKKNSKEIMSVMDMEHLHFDIFQVISVGAGKRDRD